MATFCSNCGQKIKVDKDSDYATPIRRISVFFFTILAYIAILNFTSFVTDYKGVLISDIIFALIVIVFFGVNFKTVIRLFNFKRMTLSGILKIIILAPILALLVYYLAKYLNQSVFDKSEHIYYDEFKNSPAPLLFSVISMGVFPALFEEIAFRGILFNESLKIMGLKPTIFLTAILFTILHLSLISIIWLFPGGLLLGYLRAKYNTLFYGMLAHFTYNTAIVIIQIALS